MSNTTKGQAIGASIESNMAGTSQPDKLEIIDAIFDYLDGSTTVDIEDIGDAMEGAGISVRHEQNDVMTNDGICKRKKTPPAP